MTVFLEKLVSRIARFFRVPRFDRSEAAVNAEQGIAALDVELVPAEVSVAGLVIGVAEPVPAAVMDPVRVATCAVKRLRLAMRLRLVAKIQAQRMGRAPKPIGKARANLKPKPVVVGRACKKRGPDLFASKIKRPVAIRPATKIFIAKRPKKSAEILVFPVRKPLSVSPRLKRAA